jgi:hypothetical protein
MDGPSLRGVKSLLLGLAPLAFYLAREGRAPGWSPGSGDLGFVDGLLPALLMSPILLLGLVWRRTPFIAGLALVYPAFYLVYATVLGRGVESWYMVQPLFLGLLGFSIVVDQLIGPAKAAVRTARGGLGVAAGLLVFGLVAVQVVAPSTWEPKSELLAPISKNSQQSLQEVYDVSKADPLFEMRGHMTDEDLRHQFLIDFGWFYIAYPMAEGAASVRYGYTGYELTTVAEVQRWTSRIENSTATVIHTPASLPPLNHALRAAYADCRTFENEDYEVFRGAECGDRLAAVVREYEARVGRSLG